MRSLLIASFLFCLLSKAYCQQDTIVVTDYTKVLITTDSRGDVFPVTNLDDHNQVGFFINQLPEGKIKFCNTEELFVWVDGKLFMKILGCEFLDPKKLYANAKRDTIYVSLSSSSSLKDLVTELVIFEELIIVRDDIALPRQVRSTLYEFLTISLILIFLFLGILLYQYPARISFLFRRSFALKASAYEFVNTSFFSGASMYLLAFYSLILSFTALYLDNVLEIFFLAINENIWQFLFSWIKYATVFFCLVIFKWVLISIVAALFNFRGLKNYQLFDFINFNLVLLVPIFSFVVVDFILHSQTESWVKYSLLHMFPIILILFVLWFTLKFVNNSTRKKLVIISYLCATEIVPATFLLAWFFK